MGRLTLLSINAAEPGAFSRMKRDIHIVSYFSLPTDLAGEMRDWPEFVAGQEYSVDLILFPNPGSFLGIWDLELWD